MGKKNAYSEEVKMAVIEMKLSGEYSNREIMDKFGITNVTQVKRWMQWYREGQKYRLAQGIGKQYSYGKGPEELSDMEKLKRENEYLKAQLEILKKVPRNREELVPEAVVTLVEKLKEKYSVTFLCRCLGIPKSTYYRWRNQGPKGKTELEIQITEICKRHKFLIGHRTVKAWLLRDYKRKVNRNTVQRIMQKYNLQCQVKPKRKNNIAGEIKIVVPNHLNRNFTSSKPNEKWVTDITYLPFGQSMLYLSTIMDLFNNEIIAYLISTSQDVSLVVNTLKDAVEGRDTSGLILHSDQGAQYTSHSFQRIAKEKGITTSMSRKGNCLDNAVIESFHSTIKSEEFYSQGREFLTNSIVIERVEKFINHYNQTRLQAKLNYLSPIEFREQAA
ncbi:IS3 family transposase [Neobacillus rhizophilus]|uniref:IS3 family transposase n=2 Tax=Neobacillus rhizophilus TaxID=2833579 RepID=A0A942YUZ1_9BACI|nr:IS3 family transposase [Neobacillus rhizophilus]MBS4212460.1 IS3 family transposase [Neobacillus rhizophilus]